MVNAIILEGNALHAFAQKIMPRYRQPDLTECFLSEVIKPGGGL
jgi:hypothetical protein